MLRGAFTAWLLALVLALTSVTASVARAQAAGATEMVICSGLGVTTITVDAEGNPADRMHHCPLCLAAPGDALLPAPPGIDRPLFRRAGVDRPADVVPVDGPSPVPSARGPPVAV